MSKFSAIDPALHQAYAAAFYCVNDPSAIFTLHPGEYSPDVMRMYLDHDTSSAAFLTAFNPFSQIVSDAENAAAQKALEAELTKRGFTWLSGFGCDKIGAWPEEVSVLVLGIGIKTATAISQYYSQNAFLFAAEDAVPNLILNN
jgi:hypothetical protein